MNIQINNVLGLSKLQYINLVDSQFNIYCEHLSYTFFVPMRELQQNTKLYNWFIKKWQTEVVNPFLKANEDFIMSGVKDPNIYLDLFTANINDNNLIGSYPAPIVNQIKKAHYKALKND